MLACLVESRPKWVACVTSLSCSIVVHLSDDAIHFGRPVVNLRAVGKEEVDGISITSIDQIFPDLQERTWARARGGDSDFLLRLAAMRWIARPEFHDTLNAKVQQKLQGLEFECKDSEVYDKHGTLKTKFRTSEPSDDAENSDKDSKYIMRVEVKLGQG